MLISHLRDKTWFKNRVFIRQHTHLLKTKKTIIRMCHVMYIWHLQKRVSANKIILIQIFCYQMCHTSLIHHHNILRIQKTVSFFWFISCFIICSFANRNQKNKVNKPHCREKKSQNIQSIRMYQNIAIAVDQLEKSRSSQKNFFKIFTFPKIKVEKLNNLMHKKTEISWTA